MSMKKVTRKAFQALFEDSLAIIEADYKVVHFRYFINCIYGLGIAVTYKHNTADVEREYYVFTISEEITLRLTSAYLYITDITQRERVLNSEMIAIFNAEIQTDIKVDSTQHFILKNQKEVSNGSNL